MVVMVQNSSKNAWCWEVPHYILLGGGKSHKNIMHGTERVNLEIIDFVSNRQTNTHINTHMLNYIID